jgi:hypothetical protein
MYLRTNLAPPKLHPHISIQELQNSFASNPTTTPSLISNNITLYLPDTSFAHREKTFLNTEAPKMAATKPR